MSKNERLKLELPILSILGLIFITLKLIGYINWSWWYVLMPFWLPIVVGLLIITLIAVFGLIRRKSK